MSSSYPSTVIPLGGWASRAACRAHEEPELWFATNTRDRAKAVQAKKVCDGCPVRAECLDDALRRGDPDSIAGGMTPQERREYQAARKTLVKKTKRHEMGEAA